MLYILGAGSAYPATVIDNQLLASLRLGGSSSAIFEETGIEKRCSCLPVEYIKRTGNQDRSQAPAAALETPTEMAVRACRMALFRAGIAPEEVGLILGESCTALQSVPAEAQRVAGAFGLKIPAYDVSSAGVGLPFMLDLVGKWRPEAAPDYVLCFSSNTPTQAVHYSGGREALYFGDAAGAAVVSLSRRGKLRVLSSLWENNLLDDDPAVLPLAGHLSVNFELLAFVHKQRIERMAGIIGLGDGAEAGACQSALTFSSPVLCRDFNMVCGDTGYALWQGVCAYGETLGSAGFCVLAEGWDQACLQQKLCLMVPGLGAGYGGVVVDGGEYCGAQGDSLEGV